MRTVVAMSGGVDSSVAAALIREAGDEAIGVFMRLGMRSGEAGGRRGSCCSAEDAGDARRVAAMLGVPFYVVDFAAGFDRLTMAWAESYRAGLTPNPCVTCNRDLKFGRLMEVAKALGAEALATGHYARLDTSNGRVRLMRAVDRAKDQSYFLAEVAPEALAFARFPLGGMTKPEVRAYAARRGLPVADKAESMEICFVPGGDYREVLAVRGGTGRPGDLALTDGRAIGRHGGVGGFTVGQRRGLGVATGRPLYVTRVEPETGRVVLGEAAALERTHFGVSHVNWTLGAPPAGPVRCAVQVRHRHRSVECTATPRPDGGVDCVLDRPERAVAPGQVAVFYAGDEVLGGGEISPVQTSTAGPER